MGTLVVEKTKKGDKVTEENRVQEKFNEFEKLWTLTNGKPTENSVKDKIAILSIKIVLLGAMGLSGTRTGSMVAETEQLAHFFSKLGTPDSIAWMFTGMEAILAFFTVEVGMFLAGYLLGDRETIDRRWYLYFTVAAIFPAFVSNIGPGFRLIGEDVFSFWLVVVNVIVGLSTIALALIGGRVMAVIENEFSSKYTKVIETWEDKRQKAWYRSKEYKSLRKVEHTPEAKETPEQKLFAAIVSNGESATISAMAKQVGMNQSQVMKSLKTLQQEKKVVVEGVNITRL